MPISSDYYCSSSEEFLAMKIKVLGARANKQNRPDSFGDFMFLCFVDTIRIRSDGPIHVSNFSTVARTHAISEKPDPVFHFALAPTNVYQHRRQQAFRFFRNMMGTRQGELKY